MKRLRWIVAVMGLCWATDSALKAADSLTLDDLFPNDAVLDVRIQMDPQDWNSLRYQTRDRSTIGNRQFAPIPNPFTYFEGDVTINGVSFPKVGLRKKGFIGSLSHTRPSLKVKLNFTDPEGEMGGLRTLTFNNNNQDTGLLSQYLSYRIFNQVGSPAPRCAFARVTVNGKNLGVYSHVETVRKPLLKREFGDDAGTLYEGTVVDFNPGWVNSFELKTGEDEPGRKKIAQVIKAMEGDPGNPLFPEDTPARAWVPTGPQVDGIWMHPDFDDSQWRPGAGGVGFEDGQGYEDLIGAEFDFGRELRQQQTSVYLRIPFDVADPEQVARAGQLVLRVRYDDGFVAYLNGKRVASGNGPAKPRWNSQATENHDDGQALSYQPFYLEDAASLLVPGRNVLAVHGLNVAAGSTDMLVAAVLRLETLALEEVVGEHVDLDAFYRFWAIEGLLGFWDGYSGNRNNFFVYHHPGTDKMHFLPWGADCLFTNSSMVHNTWGKPISVKTQGLIANRFWKFASARERYARTMMAILDEHWDADALLAETDRMEALLRPHVDRSQRRFDRSLNQIRRFIRGRRSEVLKEIRQHLPAE